MSDEKMSDIDKANAAADLAIKALPLFVQLLQAVAELKKGPSLLSRALPHLHAATRAAKGDDA